MILTIKISGKTVDKYKTEHEVMHDISKMFQQITMMDFKKNQEMDK